ncbi:MAG: TRAP transporter small permease subunit [Syntrophales bacterium]
MMEKIRAIIEKSNLYLGIISGMGILFMGLILTYEVVCRYIFNAPTIWTQEVSIYLFMWTMLAASSYTLQTGKHVRVDLLLEKMRVRTRLLTEGATGIVGALYCLIVTQQAWQMLAMSFEYGKLSATPLRVPLWIPQSALLIGFVLLTLQFIIIVLKRLSELRAIGNRGAVR